MDVRVPASWQPSWLTMNCFRLRSQRTTPLWSGEMTWRRYIYEFYHSLLVHTYVHGCKQASMLWFHPFRCYSRLVWRASRQCSCSVTIRSRMNHLWRTSIWYWTQGMSPTSTLLQAVARAQVINFAFSVLMFRLALVPAPCVGTSEFYAMGIKQFIKTNHIAM